jgi:hypothetical protein
MYAVLAVMSVGCAFAHADLLQNHHHHSEEGSSSNQNAFCAWACQATSDVVAVVQPPVAAARLVVEQQILASDLHYVSSPSAILQSRAPPNTGSLSYE